MDETVDETVDAAPDVADVTVRENDLIMTVEAGITASFDFDASSFDVSAGQPKGRPPVVSSFTESNQRLNLRVYAGRKRTSSVAEVFNNRTTARVATRREQASGGPSELNFTFSGKLTLNGDVFPNFNIGQGSKGSLGGPTFDNWWVGVNSGGETAAKNGNAFLCLTGPTGARYQITLPGNNSFKLSIRVLGAGEACGS